MTSGSGGKLLSEGVSNPAGASLSIIAVTPRPAAAQAASTAKSEDVHTISNLRSRARSASITAS